MEQINQENQTNLDGDKHKFDTLKNKVLDDISSLRRNIEEKFSLHPDIDENISGIKLRVEKIENNKHLFILEFLGDQISEIDNLLSNININSDKTEIRDKFHTLKYKILNLYDFCKNYIDFSEKVLKKMVEKLMLTHKNLEGEIEKFGKLNDVLKNHKTYEIYKQSEDLNDGVYKKYIQMSVLFAIGGFILSIVISLIFTQCFFEKICILKYDMVDYWFARVSVLLIAITGVTFCLKQAIHHQKKKDKAEQTRLELEALPTYMFNFSDEQKNKVYKELTGKYFGRDFDNEGYQAMSDIIQEQIKLSNEVLKSVIAKN